MVISPFLTVEEAYLAAKYARSVDENALLVVGPVPVEGSDERYPSGFVISAEKAPNRRGVEEVIAGFGGNDFTWGEFLEHDDERSDHADLDCRRISEITL